MITEIQTVDELLDTIYQETRDNLSLVGIFPAINHYFEFFIRIIKLPSNVSTQNLFKRIIDHLLHLETLYSSDVERKDYFQDFFTSSYSALPSPIRNWLTAENLISLNQNYWRFLLAGKHHYQGPYAYEFEKIGYLRALRNSFFYTLVHISERLSYQVLNLINMYATDRIFSIDRLEEEKNYTFVGSYLMGRPGPVATECTTLINAYRNQRKQAKGEKDKILEAIINLVQELVHLSPFPIHNLETFAMILLNRELIIHFQTAIWLYNPSIFRNANRAELTAKVKEAMSKYTLFSLPAYSHLKYVTYFKESFISRPKTLDEAFLIGDWNFIHDWLEKSDSNIDEQDVLGKSVFYNILMNKRFCMIEEETMQLALEKSPALSLLKAQICYDKLIDNDPKNPSRELALDYLEKIHPCLQEEDQTEYYRSVPYPNFY